MPFSVIVLNEGQETFFVSEQHILWLQVTMNVIHILLKVYFDQVIEQIDKKDLKNYVQQ